MILLNKISRLILFTFLFGAPTSFAFATQYFVAPDGDDSFVGNILLPFKTIQRVQTLAVAGDTVFIRGGTYAMSESQITTYSSIWAYVTHLTKSGTAGKRINYWAYQAEKPVFDYTAIIPANYRINAFEVTGSWVHIKGIEVTGVQVTITTSNTQSLCFDNTGSNNIYEQLSMHDGQAIGFYLTKGSNNLILNCDAYRNNDYTSQSGGGVNGGNVDGFGNHPNSKGNVNNVFKGCRAWLNSDDGFDCISAHESTIFDSCWAFYNGYAAGFVSRGDGNGFKAGGYGSIAASDVPNPVPRNTIRFCLAVRNKANGFYSNHHINGSDWFNNSAYNNSTNFNMLNRLSDNVTDVAGYRHNLKNNLGYLPRSTELLNIDSTSALKSDVSYNYFNLPVTVTAADFLSLDTSLLRAPRQADGSLPNTNFMKLSASSDLIDKGMNIGFPYSGSAPDLGCYEYMAATLPVELSSFTATTNNGNVLLQWEIVSENQNRGWEIERAAFAENNLPAWQNIGFVAGKNNSTTVTNYSFNDRVPIGKYQYRLKQMDADGRFKYSATRVVSITNKEQSKLSIFPSRGGSGAVINYSL